MEKGRKGFNLVPLSELLAEDAHTADKALSQAEKDIESVSGLSYPNDFEAGKRMALSVIRHHRSRLRQ